MEDWRKQACRKFDSVQSQIPNHWVMERVPTPEEEPNALTYLNRILPQAEVDITDASVVELSQLIREGKLTSVQVTETFCHRAACIHQMTNCCSEIFFNQAKERAEYLDAHFKKTGQVVGALHGIPISLKDQVNLEGIDSAIGYVSLTFLPKDSMSLIAKILLDQGAVFFVKTTTPMAMMAPDMVSNIYGYTKNSINRNLSCGGSSGGEGALIGARGALMGFGTDIGGSVRIPSAFQGIYALKCSSNRLPFDNLTNSMQNQTIMCSVIGPMCCELSDLKMLTKLVIDSQPWMKDPKVPPIPWREQLHRKHAVFGVLENYDFIKPHPPILRAISMVKEALAKAGHKYVPWTLPVTKEDLAKLAGKIYGADGFAEITGQCAKSGEPIVNELLFKGGTLPAGCKTINEYWDLAGEKYEYQKQVDHHWSSAAMPVDAFITPAWDSCSFRSGDCSVFPVARTSSLNVLDYSVMVIPVTYASKVVDKVDAHYHAVNPTDKLVQKYYDPDLYHKTPVCVQIVAPRYCEERAIHLAEVVRDALNQLECSAQLPADTTGP